MDMMVNWFSGGQHALRQAIVRATQEAEQLDDAWMRVLGRLRPLSHPCSLKVSSRDEYDL